MFSTPSGVEPASLCSPIAATTLPVLARTRCAHPGNGPVVIWPQSGDNHEAGQVAYTNVPDLHSCPDCCPYHRHLNKNEASSRVPQCGYVIHANWRKFSTRSGPDNITRSRRFPEAQDRPNTPNFGSKRDTALAPRRRLPEHAQPCRMSPARGGGWVLWHRLQRQTSMHNKQKAAAGNRQPKEAKGGMI
jgi:hypothetical protein